MKKEKTIQLTIETPAIGDVLVEVPYTEDADDNFILEIPNRKFWGTDYTKLDLSLVVDNDIDKFKKLNAISDENHQVYIDTLRIYGVRISGNFIRIEYWFDQFLDDSCHRMCSGVLTHLHSDDNIHRVDKIIKVFPECYSKDVCIYW